MKPKSLFILLALMAGMLFSCFPGTGPKVKATVPHLRVITKVTQITPQLSGDGYFTTVLHDTSADYFIFRTAHDSFTVPNDRTPNFIVGRYDPRTYDLLWVNMGGGKGSDCGCQYFSYYDPKLGGERALYVVGFYEDTAYFSLNASRGTKSVRIGPGKGLSDMFVARYDADTGSVQWIATLGSTASDVGSIYTDKAGVMRRKDGVVLMVIDTNKTTLDIYAHFGAPFQFGSQQIVPEGRYVKLTYERADGTKGPTSAYIPKNVPDDD